MSYDSAAERRERPRASRRALGFVIGDGHADRQDTFLERWHPGGSWRDGDPAGGTFNLQGTAVKSVDTTHFQPGRRRRLDGNGQFADWRMVRSSTTAEPLIFKTTPASTRAPAARSRSSPTRARCRRRWERERRLSTASALKTAERSASAPGRSRLPGRQLPSRKRAGRRFFRAGNLSATPVLQFAGGVLSGAGTITGSVANSGGIVQPGGVGVAGALSVTGSYSQGAGGRWRSNSAGWRRVSSTGFWSPERPRSAVI